MHPHFQTLPLWERPPQPEPAILWSLCFDRRRLLMLIRPFALLAAKQ
jgi:hypothetical protein